MKHARFLAILILTAGLLQSRLTCMVGAALVAARMGSWPMMRFAHGGHDCHRLTAIRAADLPCPYFYFAIALILTGINSTASNHLDIVTVLF